MSLVTQLAKGQIDPATFVQRASDDIAKDAKIFQAIPGVKAIENWAIDLLSLRLSSIGLSSTIVDLIITGLKHSLGLDQPDTPKA